MSVDASLNKSRSIAAGRNSNLFHCLWQISELDPLLPLIPELLLMLLLLLLNIPLLFSWEVLDDGWGKSLISKHHAGMRIAKPIMPIISTHAEPLFLSSVHLSSSFYLNLEAPFITTLFASSSPGILQGASFRKPCDRYLDNIYCSCL